MAASRPHIDQWRREKEVEENRSRFRGSRSPYSSAPSRGRSRDEISPSRRSPSSSYRSDRGPHTRGRVPINSPHRNSSYAHLHRDFSRDSYQSSHHSYRHRKYRRPDDAPKSQRRSASTTGSPHRREILDENFPPRIPPSASVDHPTGNTSASRRRSRDSSLAGSGRREASPRSSNHPASHRRRTPTPPSRLVPRKHARSTSTDRSRKKHRIARDSSPDHTSQSSRYQRSQEENTLRHGQSSLDRPLSHKGTPKARDASASPRPSRSRRDRSYDRRSYHSTEDMPPYSGSYRGGRGAHHRDYDNRPPHYRTSRGPPFGHPEADSRSHSFSSRQPYYPLVNEPWHTANRFHPTHHDNRSPYDDPRGPYPQASRDDHPSRSYGRGHSPPHRPHDRRHSPNIDRSLPGSTPHSSYKSHQSASEWAHVDERNADAHSSAPSSRTVPQTSGSQGSSQTGVDPKTTLTSSPAKKPEGETKLRFSLKGKAEPASGSDAAPRTRKALVFDDSKTPSQIDSARSTGPPSRPKAELEARPDLLAQSGSRRQLDVEHADRSQEPPREASERRGPPSHFDPRDEFFNDSRGRPPPGPRRRGYDDYRDWPRGRNGAHDYDRAPPAAVRDYDRGPPPLRDYEAGPPRNRIYERGPPSGGRDYARGPPAAPRDYDRGRPPGAREWDREPHPVREYSRRPPLDPRDYDRGPPVGPRDYGRAPHGPREYIREPPPGPRGYHHSFHPHDPYDSYYRDDPYYDDPYGRPPFPRERPRDPLPPRRGPPPRQGPGLDPTPVPPSTPPRKVIKRQRPKRTLAPELLSSESVYFRKPGNESVVGSGTYGKVFKAVHVYTGVKVALKKIRMEGERDGFPVTAIREVKLLQSLHHPNIVNLSEVMVERNDCYMVFEYLSHDLTGLLNHPTFKLTEAHKKYLAKQLFEGLDYLHRRGVLHRDIKAANILVSSKGQLKLADFGLARFFAKRRQLDYTNRVITIWYRSPELLLGETRYDATVDIWSAACVLVEIFTRHAIFPGDGGEISQLDKIYHVLGTPTRSEWPGLAATPWFELLRPSQRLPSTFEEKYAERVPTKAALELLKAMFVYDPLKRPDAGQVLAHPYFTEEEPRPESVTELEGLEGEWHEFESKALRREKDRAEREARRAKEAGNGAGEVGISQMGAGEHDAHKDEREKNEREKRKRERARAAEDNDDMGMSVAELFGEEEEGREGKRARVDVSA